MIIGITGSIGSGKTTIAKLFGKHGFKVIDADKFYAGLYRKNKAMRKSIKAEFGTTSRTRIKKIVFSNSDKLLKLNKITHPIIIDEIKKYIKKIKNNIRKIRQKCDDNAKIIVDAPLLLETKAKNLVDKIIVVKCSKSNILKRNKKFTRRQIEKILKAQMPLKEKLKYADFVVDNNKNSGHLEEQVEKIIKELN